MKIGYLISQYPALSHTFILREIQQLEKLGWNVRIASINNADRPFEAMQPEEQAHARHTYFIKKDGTKGALKALVGELLSNPSGVLKGLTAACKLAGPNLKDLLLYLFYFVEALMVAQWMRHQQLNHLHVHFAGPAASVGMLCKHILNCRFSLTVHGPDELSDVAKHRLQQKFAAADQIICITHYAQSRVMLHADVADWDKTRVVRVGLECEPFLALGEKRESVKTGASRPIPSLLSIGRMAPAKGQKVLFEALSELKKRNCNVHLTLIGTGPMRAMLEQEAQRLGLTSETLTLTGGLNQDQVRSHLQSADLFVLSSFAEGLPVVLMEALLANVPCVATTIAGIPELIRHEEDGLLVPAGSSQALADAIQACVENPQQTLHMAQSGKQRVMAMHDIRLTAQSLSECFSELHA